MPKVTVLLTSYNYERFLGESVSGVLSQTFSDLELIVVDDCSQDGSLKLLKSFDDSRLTVIENKKNMGQEYAFDLITTLAKGEYIAIADADCRWLPEKLQAQVDYLDSHPECAAVFTKANFIDENGNPSFSDAAGAYDVFSVENRTRQDWLRRFFYEGNCLCNPSVLMRRSAYEECYYSANGIWNLQDMCKWIRLLLKYEIYILDSKLIDFRLHNSNMSGPFSIKAFMRISNEMYQIYNEYYNISVADFIAAFPDEAKKYTVNGKINIKFALSKTLLACEHPAAKALALNKLFEMLNDPAEKPEIAALYNYSNTAYRDDETVNIPYLRNPLMSTAKQFNAKLYFDFGEGYSENNSVAQTFFPEINGAFSFAFSGLDSLCGGKPLKRLRFDPHDSFIKIRIDSITCDGEEITFKPEKRQYLFCQSDGYDVFYTDDPNYQLFPKNGDIKDIVVKGEIFYLETPFLSSRIGNISGSLSEAAAQLERTQEELSQTSAALSEVRGELNKVAHELNMIANSFSWKITRPIRGVKKVLKKLLKR